MTLPRRKWGDMIVKGTSLIFHLILRKPPHEIRPPVHSRSIYAYRIVSRDSDHRHLDCPLGSRSAKGARSRRPDANYESSKAAGAGEPRIQRRVQDASVQWHRGMGDQDQPSQRLVGLPDPAVPRTASHL